MIPLTEKSSYLTTFNTPFGRHCFLRLPFGINVSQDVFQRHLDDIMRPIRNVKGIADDLVCAGSTETEHDQSMIQLLDVCRDNNLKLNSNKIHFKKDEIHFYSNIIRPAGMKPDPEKVLPITSLPRPTDIPKLGIFLGMANYLNRFSPVIPDSTTAGIDEEQCCLYLGGPEQQRAFEAVKEQIARDLPCPSLLQSVIWHIVYMWVACPCMPPDLQARWCLVSANSCNTYTWSILDYNTKSCIGSLDRLLHLILRILEHQPQTSPTSPHTSACPIPRSHLLHLLGSHVNGQEFFCAWSLSPQPISSKSLIFQTLVHLFQKRTPAMFLLGGQTLHPYLDMSNHK